MQPQKRHTPHLTTAHHNRERELHLNAQHYFMQYVRTAITKLGLLFFDPITMFRWMCNKFGGKKTTKKWNKTWNWNFYSKVRRKYCGWMSLFGVILFEPRAQFQWPSSSSSSLKYKICASYILWQNCSFRSPYFPDKKSAKRFCDEPFFSHLEHMWKTNPVLRLQLNI